MFGIKNGREEKLENTKKKKKNKLTSMIEKKGRGEKKINETN